MRRTACARCSTSSASARTELTARRASNSGRRGPRASSSATGVGPTPADRGGDRAPVRDHEVALRRATELFAPQIHREESAEATSRWSGARSRRLGDLLRRRPGNSEPRWVREFGAPSGEDGPHRARAPHQPRPALAALRRRRPLLPLRARPAHAAFDGACRAPVGLVRQPGAAQRSTASSASRSTWSPPAADNDAILPRARCSVRGIASPRTRANSPRSRRPSSRHHRPTTTTTSRHSVVDPSPPPAPPPPPRRLVRPRRAWASSSE